MHSPNGTIEDFVNTHLKHTSNDQMCKHMQYSTSTQGLIHCFAPFSICFQVVWVWPYVCIHIV